MLVPLLLLLGVAASSLAPARGDDIPTPMPLARFPTTYFCTPTADSCNPKGPNNKTFEANFANLSDALPKEALASGFASRAFGAAPDTAYGLVLCRGDFTGDQCVSCLEMGIRTAVSILCAHSPDVTVYYDQCQFRFSNQDFLSGESNSPEATLRDTNNVSTGNVAAFDDLVAGLLRAVADVASKAAGRYGTGQAGFPPEGTNVYALAQCKQDLTPRQCQWCLEGLIGDMPRYWFTGSVGARIQGVRCNIMYDEDHFFVTTRDTVTLTPLINSSSSSSPAAAGGRGLIIGVGVGSGTSILLLALGGPFIMRKIKLQKAKKMEQKIFKQNHGLLLQQLMSHNTDIGGRMIITLKDLEKATNNFDRSRVVGGGGHGVVFKGILGLHVVAIKKSKIVVQREIDECINEVAVLSQVNHRNVVNLLGCCLEVEVPLLVYEFISNGTLDHHLHVDGPISLSWYDRIKIAMEVARALSYLHSSASMPIFHRDIKSSNILLDDALTAKVSDFGASRYIPIDQTGVTTVVQGTMGYLDPMMYYYTGRLTDKSDIFSFGVLLIELLTRKKPYVYRSVDNAGLVSHFVSLHTEGKLVDIIDAQVMEEETGEIQQLKSGRVHLMEHRVAASSLSPAAWGDGNRMANPMDYFCTPMDSCNSKRPNSTFEANLAALSDALPRNALVSGFASGAFGAAPDTVYGLVLCRGDFIGEQCVSCLESGLRLAVSNLCVGSRDATLYYDQCYFRFSDQDFLAGDSNSPETAARNMNNVSSGDVAAFDAVVTGLMGAVADLASNATSRYGTGMAWFSQEWFNVYALAQCTQDLTPAQCQRCLGGLIAEMPILTGSVGGRMLGVRCNIRYERELFFATPLPPNSSRSSSGLSIGIGVGSAASLLLLALGVPFIIRKIKLQKVKMMKEKFFKQNHGLLLQQLISHNTDIGGRMIITLKDLEKATNNFDKSHVVGGGGHGVVFKGILGLHVVAIKKSKIVVQREISEFINEVAVLSQVNHRNVVKLLGCCLETEVPLLVYEFISNGTLDHHLHVEGPISLSWDSRVRIAIEVARALSYLHSSASMPIFHRDIKSSNILLDDALIAKVSDFGSSRYIPIDEREVIRWFKEQWHVGIDEEGLYSDDDNADKVKPTKDHEDEYVPSFESDSEIASDDEEQQDPSLPHEPEYVHDANDPSMTVGSIYPNMDVFRLALAQHSIKHEFEYNIQVSEPGRFRAYCCAKSEGCKWRIHASKMQDDVSIQVKVNPFTHDCRSTRRSGKVKQATKFWVAEKVKDWLMDDDELGPKELQRRIKDEHKVVVSVDNDGLVSHFVALHTEGKLVDIIDPQVMAEEDEEIQQVATLAVTCTKLKGEDRPTMREVEMTLETLLVKKSHVPFDRTPLRNYRDSTMARCVLTHRDTKEASRQYTMEEEILLSTSYPR
ncbi:hypothetical protein U9M48_038377 [Paspalum notatum var. saurae]|uniref:Uncharacterized protein n=1 Tax=Paspalum notatum var. saurae TaxID=547442 RepID=A0AAQ3UL89_PASNO